MRTNNELAKEIVSLEIQLDGAYHKTKSLESQLSASVPVEYFNRLQAERDQLKAQLAEAKEKESWRDNISEDLHNALKQNHVLRQAFSYWLSQSGFETLGDSKIEVGGKLEGRGFVSQKLREAFIETPPIEGLVVCKDEPLYLIQNSATENYRQCDKAYYESVGAHGKCIVYRED